METTKGRGRHSSAASELAHRRWSNLSSEQRKATLAKVRSFKRRRRKRRPKKIP